MKQALDILNRYKSLLVGVAVVAGLALAAWTITQDLRVTPDQSYLDNQLQKAQQAAVKLDTQVINTVAKLNRVDVQPDLSNLGKADPFSP